MLDHSPDQQGSMKSDSANVPIARGLGQYVLYSELELIRINNFISALLYIIDHVFVVDPETRVQHNGFVLTWRLFLLSIFIYTEN